MHATVPRPGVEGFCSVAMRNIQNSTYDSHAERRFNFHRPGLSIAGLEKLCFCTHSSQIMFLL